MAGQGEEDVFIDAELADEPQILEGAGDAGAADAVGGMADEILVVEANGASQRTQETRDEVEQGGLACAVATVMLPGGKQKLARPRIVLPGKPKLSCSTVNMNSFPIAMILIRSEYPIIIALRTPGEARPRCRLPRRPSAALAAIIAGCSSIPWYTGSITPSPRYLASSRPLAKEQGQGAVWVALDRGIFKRDRTRH